MTERVHRMLATIASLVACACADVTGDVPPVADVSVSVPAVELSLGGTVALSASALDESGRVLVSQPIHWASNDPRIARVSTNGVVTGAGGGTTTVTAESGGRSARVTVNVRMALVWVGPGLFHTCGVTADGFTACWGGNNAGELGDSTIFSSRTPVLARSPMRFTSSDGGGTQSCSLAEDGRAFCWGANWSAQLGRGSFDRALYPFPEAVPGPWIFDALTVGDRHACGLTRDGQVACWGGGFSGQLGVTTASAQCPAVNEPCNTSPVAVEGTIGFTTVDAGEEHTCGVGADGIAYCWGENSGAQLGDGTVTDRSVPRPVVNLASLDHVSGGGMHSCAVTTAGAAYCWGSNVFGQLGVDPPVSSTTPLPVAGAIRFTQISAGREHTCGLADDGVVYCWGSDQFGQVGNGSGGTAFQPEPVTGNITFTFVRAGAYHSCGIADDGITYCWGWNNAGQLGTGPGFTQHVPTPVAGQAR